jgi:hypothetical protein
VREVSCTQHLQGDRPGPTCLSLSESEKGSS